MIKHIEDIIIVFSSVGLISIAVLDFLGLLDNIVWIKERFGAFQILAIGLLLGAVVIDRAYRLTKIEKRLKSALDNYTLGVKYLEDQSDVNRELLRTVRNAKGSLMIIGAKSSSKRYLKEILTKASDTNLKHYRLITGDHITEEMRDHLIKVIKLNDRNCSIRWNYSEKHGTIIISDEDVLIALPTSHSDKFLALKFSNPKSTTIYSEYFMDAFAHSFDISNYDQVEYLCEKNGSSFGKPKDVILNDLKHLAERENPI